MTLLRYFAYGSNLLHQRLQARTPSARPLITASLSGHALRFHKIGDDGSGKCDAFQTDRSEDVVLGVLYHMAAVERPILDRIEDVGNGYVLRDVRVLTGQGWVEAFTYLVQPHFIDEDMRPFAWYKDFVLMGARQNHFPRDYVDAIQATPSRPDPDRDRAVASAGLWRSAGLS